MASRKCDGVGDTITNAHILDSFGDGSNMFGKYSYDSRFIEFLHRKQIDILGLSMIKVTGRERGATGKIKRVPN